MLEIKDLVTNYGRIEALRGVSIEVQKGEIVAIIGANGAGKTTLMHTISGIVPPAAGKITFDGKDITNLRPHAIVRAGISLVPERRQIFDTMTVRDNLLLGAYNRFRDEKRSEIEQDIEKVCELFPLLTDRLNHPGSTLSGGMQQMLAIGRGLMAKPSLLLFDEPSLGLAPLLVREIFLIVSDLRERGTTILIVEQNAHAALHIAERGYVLEQGSIAISGSAHDLALNEDVQRAYLGGLGSDSHSV